MRGLATQTDSAPTATPAMPRPSCSGSPATGRWPASIRVSVPSRALVTQTERSPVAIRSGPRPTAIGAETETSSPPKIFWATKATRITARMPAAAEQPAPRRGPRRAARPAAAGPRAVADHARSAGPGASESTRVAAGVAPWRSRAASISAPAVG